MLNEPQQFKQAMLDYGIVFDGTPIDDGEIHRFHIEGHKQQTKNGWYVLFSDSIYAGKFGDWSQDISVTWCSKRISAMNNAEREERKRHLEREKEKTTLSRKLLQDESAFKAAQIWQKATPITAPSQHPYLMNKGVLAYGCKLFNGALVVPLFNTDKELRSLQFIALDKKQFLKGGEISGNFYAITSPDTRQNKQVIICEGFATGATLHEVLGTTVIVAFNANNLKAVANKLWCKCPEWTFIIAADNDHEKESAGKANVGKIAGMEAATATGAHLILPEFESDDSGSDFNDLVGLYGANDITPVKRLLNRC